MRATVARAVAFPVCYLACLDQGVETSMKLYVTYTSPYARLARILVVEKALEDRVEIIEAKTRTRDSPYYQINPSGRVPYLIDDSGRWHGGQPAHLRLSRQTRR